MTKLELFAKLRAAKTMPEVDALRHATVKVMHSEGESGGQSAGFNVQKEFIKAVNRMRRIPLNNRTWEGRA